MLAFAGRLPSRVGFAYSWTGGRGARLLLLGVVAVAVAWVGIGSHSASAPSVASKRGLQSLPLSAQATVSRTLGANDRRFFARRRGAALHAVNPAQSFRARFDRRGALVRAAGGTVGLALAGVGRGGRLAAVRGVAPRAHGNRVVYRHAGIRGWWANGPAGLEQGFTLARPPVSASRGRLRIALSLSGSLHPVLASGGRSVALRDAHGRTVLRYAGLSVLDARGRRLAARMALVDGRVELRVDDAGAAYPLRVDPVLQDTAAKLTASDGAPSAYLGWSVAVSGDTIVAGAPYAQVGANVSQGAAYAFVKPASGGWANATQTAKLTASDGTAQDNLGWSVAVSGDTIVAGSPLADVGPETQQGAAYVFVKPASGGWRDAVQTAKLTASDGTADDHLGWSVAASGDTIVSGAAQANVGPGTNQGAAYVFVKPASGGWDNATQTARLTPSDGGPTDDFGWSVAVSGDTIVAGSPLADVGTDAQQGAAYVFVKPASGGWQDTAAQTAKLTASDGGPGDQLGSAVAVSEDTIVAGALNADVGANTDQGAAYLFVKPASGGWDNATQTARLTASDGAARDRFGLSVVLSGDTLVVGAPYADVGANTAQGAAYVLIRPASGGWQDPGGRVAKLTASDGALNDNFGWSVAVSGDTIVAGASSARSGANTQQGAAYVFLARDTSAPAVTIDTPADGATYALGQHVEADYACRDESGGSGTRSCDGPVADGAAIDTSSPGSHDFTVTATDQAGNRASKTVHYTVRAVATPTPTPSPTPPVATPTPSPSPPVTASGCPAGTSPSVRCGPDSDGSGLRMMGTEASETLVGTSADDTMIGGGGDDRLRGRGGDDVLGGNAGDDRLVGGSGDDTVFGGDGDDRLFGSSGADRVSGRAGDDRGRGGRGDDRLFGGAGADVLEGDKDRDHVSGGAGDDHLRGGRDDDRLLGGRGDDRLLGDTGDDQLRGDKGRDELRGRQGDDELRGGKDDDVLGGGTDDDRLRGDRGADDLRGDRGHDQPEEPRIR